VHNLGVTSRSTSRLIASVCVAGALLEPSFAHAFSVENHDKITDAAVNLLTTCNVTGAQAIAARVATLKKCDRAQDALYRKVVLWHFYGRGQPLRGTFLEGDWFSAENSFDRYYQTVADGLKTAAGKRDAVGDVGALVHYVQDVCVPAHVIPIFHPSPLWSGDSFDDFAFMTPNPSSMCSDLKVAANDTFSSLLESTADATSKTIQVSTWQPFWNATLDDKRFGHYGCAGNKFGDIGAHCDDPKISWTKTQYEDFAQERHRAAVVATARVLLIGYRQGLFSRVTDERPTCPVPGLDEGKMVIKRIHAPR
jgi:hypothetical protein